MPPLVPPRVGVVLPLLVASVVLSVLVLISAAVAPDEPGKAARRVAGRARRVLRDRPGEP